MTWSLGKFITAVGIAIIVGIVLVALLGPILISIGVPVAEIVGKFCEAWGFAIGLVAGIFYYFGGP